MNALVGILGTTALLIDGEITDEWGKPRERAVLATLAVHVNRVVQIGTLIRWAWPSDTPEPRNPVETFHTYATRIRKALRRLPITAELRAGNGGYRLMMDKSHIDHQRFRALVTTARAHAAAREHPKAIALFDEALSLFRGAPLADLSSPAAESYRTGVLQNELLPANTTVIEQLLATRRFDEALVRLDDLHADYPDDVTLAALRLTALYGERRGTHATAFYFAMRKRLKDNGEDQAAEHLRMHNDAVRAAHAGAHRPTPAVTPRRLPPVHPGFVGRAEQLALLDEAANVASGAPSGVVIVDGAGGVGKTALVVQWAHRRRRLFDGGDLYVTMHGYANRAKVEQTTVVDDFLTALGQPPDPEVPPRVRAQLLSSLLTGRTTLVVLDNVRDTDHVRDLVPHLTNCLVLITTRQWLTTLRTETGARRITVPPMTASESAELLTAQLGPRHALARRHRAGLAELCGGLPLLLTVLAGNLAGKSDAGIEEYTQRLDRRQLVVGLGDHGDGPTSAAACFDPSYRALAPAERRLFRLLTLHPGPEFGLDAASACAGLPARETARGLARLTGAHLVEEADVVDRFRFHDVLGEYAAHCRDRDEPPEEQAAAARRVLDYYLGSATHACLAVHRSYNAPPALAPLPGVALTSFANADDGRLWFARERPNLMSAITFAAEREYHDHAWRLADPVTTFLDRAGRNTDSRAVRTIALASTRAIGDREAEASTLSGLGMVHMKLGEFRQARQSLEAALRLVAEVGPARAQASILHLLGRVAQGEGNPAEALDLLGRGLAIDQHSGNLEGMCWAHCRIGQVLHAIDQHAPALPHLHEAARLAHEIGEAGAAATSLCEIGGIHHDLGDTATALDHCDKALALAESVGHLPVIAETCVALCEINTARHRSRQAISCGRRAVEVCARTGDLAQHARALEVLGNAQHACGDLVDAVVAWRQAVDLHERTGNVVSAGRLRGKVDAVPVFYQEIVPIVRAEGTAGQAWPADDESTRPLGR
jgi:tetratricopeptide (TPR) repeat protein